jgi:cytochrome c556
MRYAGEYILAPSRKDSSLLARLLRLGAASLGALLLGAVLTGGLDVRAQQDAGPDRATDTILARKTLSDAFCDKMDLIEKAARSRARIPDAARDAADTISVLLLAFPHLFPPTSNRWTPDGNVDPVAETLASPEIWSDFPGFYRRAKDASRIAFTLSRAPTDEEFRTLTMDLRVACDSCHALYLEEP